MHSRFCSHGWTYLLSGSRCTANYVLNRLYCPPTVDGVDGVHPLPKHDAALPALAQLGPFRIACRRAFVTLIYKSETKVIAQASIADSCSPAIGTSTIGLKTNGHVGQRARIETADTADEIRIIGDLNKDDQFKGHPFVRRYPGARFYAEVPLRSSRWGTFGTYCVVDDEDRVLLEDENITDLQDVADAIVQHLENVHAVHCQVKSDNLLNTLMAVKGLPSIDDEQAKSDPLAEPESTLTEKLRRVSIAVQETCEIRPASAILHPPESPFFQQHEPFFNLPPSHEKHQEHLRRCSISSTNLVAVPEKVIPSALTSLLFSRASSLLQSAMQLDGAVFLDASRSNSRRLVY